MNARWFVNLKLDLSVDPRTIGGVYYISPNTLRPVEPDQASKPGARLTGLDPLKTTNYELGETTCLNLF